MKQRIMSRVQLAKKCLEERARFDEDDFRGISACDIMLHMIADGQTVKVYHDREHGGTVVEIVE